VREAGIQRLDFYGVIGGFARGGSRQHVLGFASGRDERPPGKAEDGFADVVLSFPALSRRFPAFLTDWRAPVGSSMVERLPPSSP